jgi:hypothetical protein
MLLKGMIPFIVASPVGYWAYNKRQTAISHPVMTRSFLHLAKDQRVVDFCGSNLKPGYWI